MTPLVNLTDREELLQEARNLRIHKRVLEALAKLAQLQAHHPEFSRLYQERGHCHVQLGNGPAAIQALEAAVNLNPTLPSSWDMLEQLYRMRGDAVHAATAAQHLAALKQLPSAIVVANSLFSDGDFRSAQEVLRDYLRSDSKNVGALRLLARVHIEIGVLNEAQLNLQAALALAPDYHAARLDYARVLLELQRYQEARQEALHLLAHDPDNRDYLKTYGAASIGLGDYEPVIGLNERLLDGPLLSGTEVAELRLWRANGLKVIGRTQEAIEDYQATLSARPDYGVAWFSLANLKTYHFSDEDISCMSAAEAEPNAKPMDKVYLSFALGKAHEDRRDYSASWQFYERGNTVRRSTSTYRPSVVEACAKNLMQLFTTEFFEARSDWGLDNPSPIFVLGLPRSGSTLIEQILASHSSVEGTQELTEIGRYVGEICGSDSDCGLPMNTEALWGLTATEARAQGVRFLAETQTYRRIGKPYFIDKMPSNFWHIGLIHLILPRSTIIDVRREPMASGFSNYKQLFGTSNQEFSYSLDHIAGHYRTYLDLMRHWDRVLPGRVLRVHYEDVVEDLEGNVRLILDHCRLPFETGCLAFHENQRSVRTPSSEQVRQPVGRQGLTQWQNYRPWLSPLQAALGDALTCYRT